MIASKRACAADLPGFRQRDFKALEPAGRVAPPGVLAIQVNRDAFPILSHFERDESLRSGGKLRPTGDQVVLLLARVTAQPRPAIVAHQPGKINGGLGQDFLFPDGCAVLSRLSSDSLRLHAAAKDMRLAIVETHGDRRPPFGVADLKLRAQGVVPVGQRHRHDVAGSIRALSCGYKKRQERDAAKQDDQSRPFPSCGAFCVRGIHGRSLLSRRGMQWQPSPHPLIVAVREALYNVPPGCR